MTVILVPVPHPAWPLAWKGLTYEPLSACGFKQTESLLGAHTKGPPDLLSILTWVNKNDSHQNKDNPKVT